MTPSEFLDVVGQKLGQVFVLVVIFWNVDFFHSSSTFTLFSSFIFPIDLHPVGFSWFLLKVIYMNLFFRVLIQLWILPLAIIGQANLQCLMIL